MVQRIGDLMARPAGAKEAYTEILNEPEIAKALHQYQDDIDPSLISNYISDLDEFLRNKEKCNLLKAIIQH